MAKVYNILGGSGGGGVESVKGVGVNNTDPSNPIVDIPLNTSDLINDGEDGVNPFITLEDLPPLPPTVLSALPFSTDHLATTNNQYVIGDVVYYLGNVYRCIANNDSIVPTTTSYWVIIGPGFPTVQQPADWNSTTDNNQILNKPTIPSITGLVPYTGATTNVNIGTNNIVAQKFIKNGGSTSELLAANGDVTVAGRNINIVSNTIDVDIPPFTLPVSSTLGPILNGIPYKIIIDSKKNLYISDVSLNSIVKMTPSGLVSTLGFTSPQGSGASHMTMDSSGNIYVANIYSYNVSKITPQGIVTLVGSTGATPSGIVVDSVGNLYTSNFSSNNVTKITPSGVTTVIATINAPQGIAIDLTNNIYVTSFQDDNVTKITPGGVVSILGTTGDGPYGIIVDSVGNIYTSNYHSRNITKIVSSGTSITYGFTGVYPYYLTIDLDGNVYTANYLSNNVTKITPLDVSTVFGTTGNGPNGIAIDSSGVIYTANSGSNNVTKITPDTKKLLAVDNNLNIIRVEEPVVTTPNLQQVTDGLGNNITTNEITAAKLIKDGGQPEQFLKADGSVDNNVYLTSADLPATLDLYATTTVSDTAGYGVLVRNISDPRFNTIAQDVTTPVINGTAIACGSLITDANIISGNPGVFNFTVSGNIRKISGPTASQAEFYFRIYKRVSAGTETLIIESAKVLIPNNSGTYALFSTVALWNDGIFLSTDRIVLKFYGDLAGTGSGGTYQFQFGGIVPVRGSAAIPAAVLPNIYLRDLADVENVDALNNEVLYWNDTASLWEHSLVTDLIPVATESVRGLVKGGDFKTVAGQPILGTGNISITTSFTTRQNANNSSNPNINYCGVALGQNIPTTNTAWTIKKLTISAAGVPVVTTTTVPVRWVDRELAGTIYS